MNIATSANFDPVARAMAALPPGYYWVRLSGNAKRFEVAELREGAFFGCGCETPMRPANIAEIGDKLRTYQPKPNPPPLNGAYWVRLSRESAWRLASWIGGPSGRWYMIGADDRVESCQPEAIAVVGPMVEKPRSEWLDN